MKFFQRPAASRECLVLDIGASALSSFVVRVQEKRAPEVIFPTAVSLGFSDEPHFLERRIKKAASELFPVLKKKLGALSLEQILVVFSSPWYVPYTRSIRMARPEPFIITSSLLEELIAEELEFLKRKSQEMFSGSEEAAILENHVMKALCNGYHVRDPVGKRTRELELALYVSLARGDFLEEMKDILHNHFGALPIKMTSSALVLFLILRDILNAEEGFLLLDVAGEVTEVGVVRTGILEKVQSFPAGENFIVRFLASSLGLAPLEVIPLLAAKAAGTIKAGLDEKVSGLLSKAGERWCQYFKRLLEKIGEEGPLPRNLLLVGGAWSIEAVKSCCESQELSRFTILGQSFRALTFLPEDLDGRLSISGFDRKDPKMTRPVLFALAGAEVSGGSFKKHL